MAEVNRRSAWAREMAGEALSKGASRSRPLSRAGAAKKKRYPPHPVAGLAGWSCGSRSAAGRSAIGREENRMLCQRHHGRRRWRGTAASLSSRLWETGSSERLTNRMDGIVSRLLMGCAAGIIAACCTLCTQITDVQPIGESGAMPLEHPGWFRSLSSRVSRRVRNGCVLPQDARSQDIGAVWCQPSTHPDSAPEMPDPPLLGCPQILTSHDTSG